MPVSAEILRTHIDYTAWASNKILDAASRLSSEELNRDFQTADRSVLGTLVHTFAGDRIWLSRMTGRAPGAFVTDADRSLAVIQAEWPAVLDGWKKWAGGLTDEMAAGPLAYVDMKGRSWSRAVWQVVLHVVNHGTHHRGQVSGMLRSMGHPPPQIDLIYYYHEHG